jgi:transcriptional regulator with GAF, ATPase, and Fis domain
MVAPTDATVLILGESGTGKELVAREIHHRSRRSQQPLIRVNCASVPRELYESEFFGHAKGAFTGAIRDRAGRFEAADGGTLLLDEAGEIPPELQSKLLRVLQEKQYERVGEETTRTIDVRILAASNRDLKADGGGRFRQDLITGSTSSPSRSLRCASTRTTSHCWPRISSASCPPAVPLKLTQAHFSSCQLRLARQCGRCRTH